jgi:RHS repeat-associated protein
VLTDYVYSGSRMIGKVSSGGAQYFLSDRLSTRLVLDTSGNVLGRQATLPFGEDFSESGTQEKHHLTSYGRDGEVGADYAVNRQYQSVGRFSRPDPSRQSVDYRIPQSFNAYTYVQNRPLDWVDVNGLDWQPSTINPGCFWNPDTVTVWCVLSMPVEQVVLLAMTA